MAEAKKPVKKTAAGAKKSDSAKRPAVAVKKPVAAVNKPAVAAMKVAPPKVVEAEIKVKAAAAVEPSVMPKTSSKPVASKAAVAAPKKPKKAASVAKKEGERGLRKTRIGKVVSNKMDKTIVVAIVNKVPHPLYGKVVVTTTKFKAHDEENACSIGDKVRIMETRPLSRDKRWRLVEVLEKVK